MKRGLTIIFLLAILASVFSVPVSADPDPETFIVIGENDRLPRGWEARVKALGGRVLRTMPEIGVAVVEFSSRSQAESLSALNGLQSVVPDLKFERIDPVQQVALSDYGNPPSSGADDFFFDLQWGHDAINAPEAWARGATGSGVRVAVLDEGFDMDHPDLAPNINYALSTSFVPGESVDYTLPDVFSHGSHVAGTIAAADNAFGTIGVAPEAELVLVKVLSEQLGYGEFGWLIDALIYAADQDVDVINMSLGATIDLTGATPEELAEIWDLYGAISRATMYAHRHGVTLITSAGNEEVNADDPNILVLPSDAPWVIDVSALGPLGWGLDQSTNLDEVAFFTNYGMSLIDYSAPGGNVDFDLYFNPSLQCTVAGVTSSCWAFDLVFSTGAGGWYWAAGTSQAAPHVSGLAAIIISEAGGSMAPNRVAFWLGLTADDLGPRGKDAFYGWGRINAEKFMKWYR